MKVPRIATDGPRPGSCPRCVHRHVVRLEEGVNASDRCLHEVEAPERRLLPRRRRHEVPRG